MERGQGEGKGGGVGRMLFVGLRSSRDIGIWCFCGPYGAAGEQGKNQLWAELGDQDVSQVQEVSDILGTSLSGSPQGPSKPLCQPATSIIFLLL